MHTEGFPKVNVPCIQDQCIMITEKISSEDDELSDDQEAYHQARSKDINYRYHELFLEYKDS